VSAHADPDRPLKHRHDIGEPDHGPIQAHGTTVTIQVLMGLWIVATIALVGFALAHIGFEVGTP
jgi:hypothetical protein